LFLSKKTESQHRILFRQFEICWPARRHRAVDRPTNRPAMMAATERYGMKGPCWTNGSISKDTSGQRDQTARETVRRGLATGLGVGDPISSAFLFAAGRSRGSMPPSAADASLRHGRGARVPFWRTWRARPIRWKETARIPRQTSLFVAAKCPAPSIGGASWLVSPFFSPSPSFSLRQVLSRERRQHRDRGESAVRVRGRGRDGVGRASGERATRRFYLVGPGLRSPLLLGGALDLRIVRIVHLVIVLVRIVLDLLHAAFARNVCRFSETLSAGKASLRGRHARTAKNRRAHTGYGISQTIWRSVREKGGGTRSLYYHEYARTAWRRGCGNRLPMAAPFPFRWLFR